MKHLKGIAMTLLLSAALVACKKDSTPPPFTMIGMWEGKIGQGSNQPSGFYALNVKSNGTVNVDGTVDKAKNKLVGNWENTGDEEGTFYASRK